MLRDAIHLGSWLGLAMWAFSVEWIGKFVYLAQSIPIEARTAPARYILEYPALQTIITFAILVVYFISCMLAKYINSSWPLIAPCVIIALGITINFLSVHMSITLLQEIVK